MVEIATTDEDLRDCHPVITELRPHIETVESFIAQVHRQREYGFQLAYIREVDRVVAVAGYRIDEALAWGKYLYIYDLVTAADCRSRGYGKKLLDWLADIARQHQCVQLHLDSGVQKFAAHRFYLRERMNITSHHFAKKLTS
jgi:ribosomal protein S18 acetylase RimI-like enzyme